MVGVGGAWSCDVSDFGRKLNLQAATLAVMLVFGPGMLLAQSSQVQAVREYELPKPVPGFSVTSEDYERFIGLRPQPDPTQVLQPVQTTPSEALGASLQPNASVQIAMPSEIPSPFPGSSGPVEQAPTWLQRAETSPTDGTTIPWWQNQCSRAILIQDPNQSCAVDLEQLVWRAMQCSRKVQSILIMPQIQQTDIDIARGELDRRRTAMTKYNDTSDPIGNTLTTGGPTRLIEQFWENSIGLRDRNSYGGKTELLQMFNARDSNSLFFQPNNQADTKLSLNYTQPLMRGAGRYYNTSSIRVAGIKTNQKFAEANRQLQDHAREVIAVYWDIVLQRYLLEQSRMGLMRLKAIEEHLMNRAGRDLLKTHLSRARAAIQNQVSQIEVAKANILSRQESLRWLVNSPELSEQNCLEIVPITMPSNELPLVPLEEELLAALNSRGDILAVQYTIQEAVVQKRLAVNEIKPQLDFDTTTYVRGLRGANQFSESYGDQFADGRPSLSAGLTTSRPVGNRAAKANLRSRELEIAQLQSQYSDTLIKARADIKSAIFAAQSSYSTTLAAIENTFFSRDEVEGHKVRFDDFFGENQSSSNVLNDLLDAENRLIAAENSWANKQIQHMLALMEIKYQSGTLMTLTAD